MKKVHIYFFIVVMLVILLFIFTQNKIQQEHSIAASSSQAEIASDIEAASRHTDQAQADGRPRLINTLMEEMSRELCKQEQAAISEIVWPDKNTLNSLKPGDAVPESAVALSPTQAIKILKRIATSKCSSFRRDHAERFFADFTLTPENYREFYSHLSVLQSSGYDNYKIIKKSLESLDHATEEEAKDLRQMILYTLKISIKGSYNFLDVLSAVASLREIREKGLISHPTTQQIELFQEHVVTISNSAIKESQQWLKKYFPHDTDFLKLTEEDMFNTYNYQNTKEQLEKERKDLSTVKNLAQQLNAIVEGNF